MAGIICTGYKTGGAGMSWSGQATDAVNKNSKNVSYFSQFLNLIKSCFTRTPSRSLYDRVALLTKAQDLENRAEKLTAKSDVSKPISLFRSIFSSPKAEDAYMIVPRREAASKYRALATKFNELGAKEDFPQQSREAAVLYKDVEDVTSRLNKDLENVRTWLRKPDLEGPQRAPHQEKESIKIPDDSRSARAKEPLGKKVYDRIALEKSEAFMARYS